MISPKIIHGRNSRVVNNTFNYSTFENSLIHIAIDIPRGIAKLSIKKIVIKYLVQQDDSEMVIESTLATPSVKEASRITLGSDT